MSMVVSLDQVRAGRREAQKVGAGQTAKPKQAGDAATDGADVVIFPGVRRERWTDASKEARSISKPLRTQKSGAGRDWLEV